MKTFEAPISQIESIYAYFNDPAHSAEIQMASDKTQYVWQHMSNYYPTEQILRDGPIHELPEPDAIRSRHGPRAGSQTPLGRSF